MAANNIAPGANNIRCVWCREHPCLSLQRLVTLGHYSLPARFISDCISALAVSAPALLVSLSYHACTRNEALRSVSTHRPHCQIRSRDRLLSPPSPVCTCSTLFHTTREPHRRPQPQKLARCKRRIEICRALCVCVFRPNDPSTTVCLRQYVSHRHPHQKEQ